MRTKNSLVVLTLLLGLSSRSMAVDLDLSQESRDESTRFRVSGNFFSFTLDGSNISGYGSEIAIEHAISSSWNFGLGFGQAYTSQGGFQTLFTVIDLGGWYALTGSFVRKKQIWKNSGTAFGNYTGERSGGLRLGLGTEQYFFATSTAAVPYSGLSVKLMYEFGKSGTYDLAIGIESAQLANGKRSASSMKALLSLIYPIL